MINFEKALSIAISEKNKLTTASRNVMLTRAKDCGEFWSISYCFTNKSGEKYETYGPKMRFDISKVNGTILDYPPYRPGTKYGNLYDKGKLLDIPEEYKN